MYEQMMSNGNETSEVWEMQYAPAVATRRELDETIVQNILMLGNLLTDLSGEMLEAANAHMMTLKHT